MGGQVFSGRTSSIEISYVNPTLNHFRDQCLLTIGLKDYCTIGSTGKKEISNDLDIVLNSKDMSKIDIKNHLVSTLGNSNVKLVGNIISACYPVWSDSKAIGTLAQIDIMLAKNVDEISWLMFGVGNGVKGVYRNLLLSYIAKVRSQESNIIKFSMAFPGGLNLSKEGETPKKITNPQLILNHLGVCCSPKDSETFEGLCSFLAKDDFFKIKLIEFENYISSYRDSESTHSEAKKCLEFLNSKL